MERLWLHLLFFTNNYFKNDRKKTFKFCIETQLKTVLLTFEFIKFAINLEIFTIFSIFTDF